jgi:hypothetical protein
MWDETTMGPRPSTDTSAFIRCPKCGERAWGTSLSTINHVCYPFEVRGVNDDFDDAWQTIYGASGDAAAERWLENFDHSENGSKEIIAHCYVRFGQTVRKYRVDRQFVPNTFANEVTIYEGERP